MMLLALCANGTGSGNVMDCWGGRIWNRSTMKRRYGLLANGGTRLGRLLPWAIWGTSGAAGESSGELSTPTEKPKSFGMIWQTERRKSKYSTTWGLSISLWGI